MHRGVVAGALCDPHILRDNCVKNHVGVSRAEKLLSLTAHPLPSVVTGYEESQQGREARLRDNPCALELASKLHCTVYAHNISVYRAQDEMTADLCHRYQRAERGIRVDENIVVRRVVPELKLLLKCRDSLKRI